MSSYIISIAQGPGSYRHIRISSDATLLDLHEAITDAYKLEKGGSPYFQPQMQAKGGQPVKYRINKSKTAVAMRDVKLKDAGFGSKKPLIYVPAETRVMLNCRTLRVLDEDTQEPQVVRASGSSFDYKLGMQRAIRSLEEHVLMQSIREAEGKVLGLPEKTQRKLAGYVLAASNLHGLVPIETIHQFYNKGYPPLDLLTFKMFCVIFSDRADTRFYILDKHGKVLSNGQQERGRAQYIAEYTVVEGKVFSHLRARQEGKPYYLPPEEEFLRWADETYMEENAHFLRLRSHLLTLGLDAEKARLFMHDIITYIRFDGTNPQVFFDLLEQYKIILKDLKAVNFALNLYSTLGNNTRVHFNCGHTPTETGDLLRDKPGGKHVRTFVQLFGPDPLQGDSTSQEEDADLQAEDVKLVQFPRRVEKNQAAMTPAPAAARRNSSIAAANPVLTSNGIKLHWMICFRKLKYNQCFLNQLTDIGKWNNIINLTNK